MSDLGRLKLSRPLAVFDLETTGTDPSNDRIVELTVCRIEADGRRTTHTRRLDPEMPIPAEATAVHGISDADVAGEKTFREIAKQLHAFLEHADLAGFNVTRFDVPLLEREFERCGQGLALELEHRRIVDAMTIFHRQEPRDLTAAVRFYLGRDHIGAHSARADVEATAEILAAQLERYPDLPDTVDRLDEWCRPEAAVDRSGYWRWRDGEVVCSFGKKYRGRPLREIVKEAPDYLQWILGGSFPSDTKQVARAALQGEFPAPRDDL